MSVKRHTITSPDSNQLSLFSDPAKDTRPLPEEIVTSLGGFMAQVDTPDGRRYCVRDWVYVVSGSTNRNLGTPLSDLRRAMDKRGELRSYDTIVSSLPNPDANNHVMDFASDAGLYEITCSMDSRSEAVRAVKSQMAKSLAFQDWARRNPEQASAFFADMASAQSKQPEALPPKVDKDYQAYLEQGYSEDDAQKWALQRVENIDVRNALTDILKAVCTGRIAYGTFTNKEYEGLFSGRTAADLRRELGVKNLRSPGGLSPDAQRAIAMAESMCAQALRNRQQVTFREACDLVWQCVSPLGEYMRAMETLTGRDSATGKRLIGGGQ